jgi:hypothetical protein
MMPPDHGLGSHEDHMLTPIAAEGTDPDPEELVAGVEPRPPPGGPGHDGKLLAEEEILGDQVGTTTQHRAEQTDEEE